MNEIAREQLFVVLCKCMSNNQCEYLKLKLFYFHNITECDAVIFARIRPGLPYHIIVGITTQYSVF